MRKIEREMLAAIRGGKNWKSGNTQVMANHYTGSEYVACDVMLHGNHIATVTDLEVVSINLCGWNTPTTRSRLTSICHEFIPGCYGVGTRDGQAELRYTDKVLNIYSRSWYLV